VDPACQHKNSPRAKQSEAERLLATQGAQLARLVADHDREVTQISISACWLSPGNLSISITLHGNGQCSVLNLVHFGPKIDGQLARMMADHDREVAGYSKVDMLGVRYKFVNFGAGKSPGSPNWWAPKALEPHGRT
jgi:hypothetical protein